MAAAAALGSANSGDAATSAATPCATYSLEQLHAAVAGNHRLAAGVADAFLKIRPELQTRLAQAVTRHDLATAHQAAHELRGMASMMGAKRLAAAAAAIEHGSAGTGGAPQAGLSALLSALTHEWDVVATALNRNVQSGQPVQS